MALLGPSARQHQQQSGRGSFGDAAMSTGLGMQYHTSAAPSSQHAILAAAAAAAAAHNQGLAQTTAAFYQNGHHQQPQQAQHSGGNGTQQPNQETQPDRPIGYGAFGVVW